MKQYLIDVTRLLIQIVMDRVDGNSRRENDQVPGTNVRTQNTGNEEGNNSVLPGHHSNAGRLVNNGRQSEENSMPTVTREKGRDLTQSCDKNPYTHRTIQKATWQHKNATKTLITQLLLTDLGRSVGVKAVTQLVWLNQFMSAQPSHSPQKLCNQSYMAR